MKHVYLIGCGGVGSYLLPPLIKRVKYGMPRGENIAVTLIDGDMLEAKNLDRQLFSAAHVGKYKVKALVEMYATGGAHLVALPEYFHSGVPLEEDSVIICCVDNHAARAACLSAADRMGVQVILAGNEEQSSQAIFYHPDWAETERDPRVMFPEILTDTSDDPLASSSGCQSEEKLVASGGQTATANFMAAASALFLFNAQFVEGRKVSREFKQHLPRQVDTSSFSVKVAKQGGE